MVYCSFINWYYSSILRSHYCEIYYGKKYGLCGVYELGITCLFLCFAISAESLCFFCLKQSVILALRSYISNQISWLKYVENQVINLTYCLFRIWMYRSAAEETKTLQRQYLCASCKSGVLAFLCYAYLFVFVWILYVMSDCVAMSGLLVIFIFCV